MILNVSLCGDGSGWPDGELVGAAVSMVTILPCTAGWSDGELVGAAVSMITGSGWPDGGLVGAAVLMITTLPFVAGARVSIFPAGNVGEMVGAIVGDTVGLVVGEVLGDVVGPKVMHGRVVHVGLIVGELFGPEMVGLPVGIRVGTDVGFAVGAPLDDEVGFPDGDAVGSDVAGLIDGAPDGLAEGAGVVGVVVGDELGRTAVEQSVSKYPASQAHVPLPATAPLPLHVVAREYRQCFVTRGTLLGRGTNPLMQLPQ